jgi:LmbE family N-acetylglucosaminyl deacetylase
MSELQGSAAGLVISPHLDDAVLSCAQLIKSRPGTTVLTVLAGFPPGAHGGWSARTTGLSLAQDANRQRREEDERASEVLASRTRWIDLFAQEYGLGDSPDQRRERIEEVLVEALAQSDAPVVFVPLGITHPDHIAVSDAALRAVLGAGLDCFIYMDMPYGQARPGRVRRRLRELRRTFAVEPPVQFVGDLEGKGEAVRAYSSQVTELQAFGRHFGRVFSDPETYWRVRPRA